MLQFDCGSEEITLRSMSSQQRQLVSSKRTEVTVFGRCQGGDIASVSCSAEVLEADKYLRTNLIRWWVWRDRSVSRNCGELADGRRGLRMLKTSAEDGRWKL